MKKQHAKKWIKALRSGEYKQAQGFLEHKGHFCCLGVLDNLYPKMNLSGGHEGYLDNFFKIGLNSSSGYLIESHWSLAELNDNGYTFDEIADVIQIEYVEGL